MPNLKAQKLKNFVGHVLEPIALGVLALLFIIPTITVVNLSPITKVLEDLNVLGTTTESVVSIDLVGGKHEVFTSENLNKISATEYDYTTTLNKRAGDSYSKPILQITNATQIAQKLTFYGQTQYSTQSNISLIIDSKTYKLQDSNGNTSTQEILIAPSEKITVFLAIENVTGVQFSEDFDMQINIVENL